MIFGENLKLHRNKLGLTQADLGKKCKLTGHAIMTYETCRSWPSRENIAALAKHLKIEESELFRDNSAVSQQRELEKQKEEILKSFTGILKDSIGPAKEAMDEAADLVTMMKKRRKFKALCELASTLSDQQLDLILSQAEILQRKNSPASLPSKRQR
jgi:transcriptional regulator with XRE-family HTH domain